jgi:hypothetical protein
MTEDREPFFPPLTALLLESQVPSLREKLAKSGTLLVKPNAHGVYSASKSQGSDSLSGYQNAWLRDNVMVAYSKWVCGDPESACKTARGLSTFLETQAPKMHAIIQKPQLKDDVHQRPHVRFDAETLAEIDQSWSHAQNDALAYVLWLRFRLANEANFPLAPAESELYAIFPRYFAAIRFWEDLDSGAWEEARKLNSSSVGAVVASLGEVARYLATGKTLPRLTGAYLDDLISHGHRTLDAQLPFEAPPERKTDAALLFLIYPMDVIKKQHTRHFVLSLVRSRLLGASGIRRYNGDSYYCQDYDRWFPPGLRSADFSDRMDLRDEFLQPGCEAQWCLFDPLLSTIYARQFLQEPSPETLRLQLEHFNRSIAQLDPQDHCPELYYLKNGRHTPNEHTPLAWTQANLAIALHHLELVARLPALTGQAYSLRD